MTQYFFSVQMVCFSYWYCFLAVLSVFGLPFLERAVADNSSPHDTHLLYTLLQAVNCLCLSYISQFAANTAKALLMEIHNRREYFWIMLY